MTYPSNFVQITLAGQLASTDSWSCSLKGHSTTPVSDAALLVGIAGMASDIADVVAPVFTDSGSFTSDVAFFDIVKVAAVGPDGHYVLGSDPDVLDAGPGGGGNGSLAHVAPQLCTVVTLRTVASRGHASRGRFFWPGAAYETLDDSGHISVSAADSMRDKFQTMLIGINGVLAAAYSADMKISVMSRLGSGVAHAVNALEVGDVIDTQRRRRRQIPENRFSGSV